MRKGTAVRAAVVVAVVLGAAGCGTGDGGPSAVPSATARAEDTGPVTKASAQADIDAAVADAGAPADDPDWAKMTAARCGAGYRGYGTEDEKADLGRYEAVVGELRERGWRPSGEAPERKDESGTVRSAQKVFTKRGWTLTAEFQGVEAGLINVSAADKACIDEISARIPLPVRSALSAGGVDGQRP
ncbi:hypothetical protein [Streptomyces sp. WAC08241]|uniref:hypothetical protein n=1 Tax=Streptomyces sp. WAC08241 TaxID=2487421 RepID=UPI00163B79CC|nr:hypothetical protein [Streptomyces sp. WAC08241]